MVKVTIEDSETGSVTTRCVEASFEALGNALIDHEGLEEAVQTLASAVIYMDNFVDRPADHPGFAELLTAAMAMFPEEN